MITLEISGYLLPVKGSIIKLPESVSKTKVVLAKVAKGDLGI